VNEEAFRSWLEKNYSANTVSTKMSEARQLAKAYGDLDQLYDHDRLSEVMESLRYSANDKAAKRTNPSKVDLTSDLYRDLSNLRTTVNYYKRFRGDSQPRPDVKSVHLAMEECASVGLEAFLETYGFGKPSTIDYWVLRDGERFPSKAIFGTAHQYMPNGSPLDGKSCNGTTAREHLAKLGFEVISGEGAPSKSSGKRPFVLYDVEGAAFQPVRNGETDGRSVFKIKAIGASNRAEDAVKVEALADVARAMLVDRLPARVQSVNGRGQVNYVGYGKQKLVRYELDPKIAAEIGVPPTGNIDEASLPNADRRSSLQEEPTKMPDPTNLILYGPPGTGKTYATAAEAVKLCGEIVPDDRNELMALYRSLHQRGRIGFVTFHQNFSYEDFVEGLRPVTGSQDEGTDASAGFSLQPQDGIFKLIADLAGSNLGKATEGLAHLIDRNNKIFKMSLGRSSAAEDDVIYQDAINGGYVVLGWGGEVDWSDPRYDDWTAIKERWRQDHPAASGNDPNMSQMYAFRINMQIGSLVVISDGNRKFRAIGEIEGPYQFVPGPNGEYNHRRKVKWLWRSEESLPRELIYEKELSQVSAYQLNSRLVDWDRLEQIIAGGSLQGSVGEPEPFVLIIDEINRANISKVFGELITLIEPDKRLGRQNALTVKLPYSKKEFGVPANLNIIGTMNTADRSIALLDTALRRRFRFKELAPDTKIEAFQKAVRASGLPLDSVLDAINDRIEYFVDREHRIGHAFFIGCETKSDVDAVMRDKVIPLLQEYFFEDWSRVAVVLGEPKGKGGGFLDCRKIKDPTGEGGEDRESWRVRDVFEEAAYEKLIGKANKDQTPDAIESELDQEDV
jgi:5-methylcytosine-specific restriction protein B